MTETCSLVQMYLTKLVLHFYFCSYVLSNLHSRRQQSTSPRCFFFFCFFLRCTYDVVTTVCVLFEIDDSRLARPLGDALASGLHFSNVSNCVCRSQGCANHSGPPNQNWGVHRAFQSKGKRDCVAFVACWLVAQKRR